MVAPSREKARAEGIHRAIPCRRLARFVCGPKILHGSRTMVEGETAADLWKHTVTPFLDGLVTKAHKPTR